MELLAEVANLLLLLPLLLCNFSWRCRVNPLCVGANGFFKVAFSALARPARLQARERCARTQFKRPSARAKASGLLACLLAAR